MRIRLVLGAALIAGSATVHAVPVTGVTGSGLPYDNQQPSLAITQVLPLQGIYPSIGGGGSALGDTLGFVYQFAGNYAPGSSASAQGQILPIAQNTALFSLLGTTYGGNGTTTYALPNLAGAATIGMGTGPGLSTQALGAITGSSSATLNTSQIPSHDHALTGGGVTGVTGGGLPTSNMQPSVALHPLIASTGVFPSRGGSGSGSAAFLGQIANFASNFIPGGWLEANGALLPISQNTALFSILGTTYGGDGKSTFALPDLRGRVAVGADADHPLGMPFGSESTTLSLAQMPSHDHTVPGSTTGATGGSQPIDNYQPSLAINYLIATQGIFPSRDDGNAGFDVNDPIIGQIVEFAGNFAPDGWAFADGSLIPIAQNTALFSILGTMYGGDGKTTFGLPDFRGRTAVGSDGINILTGDAFGSASTYLTVANLPPHDHTLPGGIAQVPEPATLALLGAGLAGLTFSRRRVAEERQRLVVFGLAPPLVADNAKV